MGNKDEEYVWVYTWRQNLKKGDIIELQGTRNREGKNYKAEAIKTWDEYVKENPDKFRDKNVPKDDARGRYWLFRLFEI